MMTTTEIILAVLSSSLISAGLTSYLNWKIHNSNYKKDYYKRILEKRIQAYEKLNEALHVLNQTYDDPQIGFTHHALSSKKQYESFRKEVNEAVAMGFWYSPKVSEKFTELIVFLRNEFSNKLKDNLPLDLQNVQYLKLANKHFDKIEDLRYQMRELINDDFKNLYKIDQFFNKNILGDGRYTIYSKWVEN